MFGNEERDARITEIERRLDAGMYTGSVRGYGSVGMAAAIRAILDHLGLELVKQPATVEKVTAQKKPAQYFEMEPGKRYFVTIGSSGGLGAGMESKPNLAKKKRKG